MASLKDQTVSGFFWKAVEKFCTYGVTFIFSILIARILSPSDYGMVGMIGVFMAVSQTFIDSGFGTALVRKLDRTQTDLSTVFYFNIAVSLFFTILLWICAPLIADFYDQPLLTPITRAMSLNLVIGSLGGIQGAKLSIDLNFKVGARNSIICGVGSGAFAYLLARLGFGVWAIVGQSLFSCVLNVALLWYFIRWKPTLEFSWKSFRNLFGFGSKLLASALLDTIYNNLTTIIIGKVFAAKALGLYSRAYGFASLPTQTVTGTLQSVTFPVLSRLQEDKEKLSNVYRRFIRLSAFIVFPMAVGMSAVAEPMVQVLLGEKWMGCVPYLRIICFTLMWWPIHSINLNILQVMGRSDYFLRLEIIKKIQGVIILCITIPMGLLAMCYGGLIGTLICVYYNTYYTKRLIGYSYFMQMRDLMPYIINSLIMYALAWGTTMILPTPVLQLTAGIIVGSTYYITIARVLKWDAMMEATAMLKRIFGPRLGRLGRASRA